MRWRAMAVCLLLAPSARAHERAPATMSDALANSLAPAGAALGLAGIDATLEPLGPTYLTNPQTLGAGAVNVNVLGGTSALDNLDGAGLDPTPEPGRVLVEG